MRGHTLLELVVTGTILLLLTTVLLGVYLVGARAWAQTESQGGLLADLQILSASLTSELERSAFEGLTVTDDALALLSPADADGRLDVDPASGALRWRRYLLFYLDSEEHVVRRVAIDIALSVPAPLEGSLLDYRTGGAVVARSVTGVFFEMGPGTRMVRLSLEAERPAYGRRDAYKVSLRTAVRVRN